eukprot:138975-Chlamydomonas_euryale.AAC.2
MGIVPLVLWVAGRCQGRLMSRTPPYSHGTDDVLRSQTGNGLRITSVAAAHTQHPVVHRLPRGQCLTLVGRSRGAFVSRIRITRVRQMSRMTCVKLWARACKRAWFSRPGIDPPFLRP